MKLAGAEWPELTLKVKLDFYFQNDFNKSFNSGEATPREKVHRSF